MAITTSSLLGANLSADDATALFALGTVAETTSGGHFEYVEVTLTLSTGQLVIITPTNTAFIALSSKMTSGAAGYDLGVTQGVISQGRFGWVAKKGRDLYVQCTGTITAGTDSMVGLGENSGRLIPLPGDGCTLFGIWITTGISGGAQPTKATLQWPRPVSHR
jgi:hypothetical protein